MEGHRFLLGFFLFFVGAIIRSGALVTPDEYWKEKLPSTSMPQLIKDSLPQLVKASLPSTGTNHNLNMGRKGLGLKYSKSLSDSKGYGVLLSYSDAKLLSDTKVYGALLSYSDDKSLSQSKAYEALLSYSDDKSLSDTKTYGALLSYNNDKSLSDAKVYGALLSYNDDKSLSDTKAYSALLSYNDDKSLSDAKVYGALLSYNDDKSLSDAKAYGALLSYNDDKSLSDAKAYGALLSYNDNKRSNKYLRLLSDVKNGLLESSDGNVEVLSHKDNKKHEQAMMVMDHFFFLEKDLHLGKNMKLHFQKSTLNALFLPRQVSKSIPFSSEKVQEIMSILSIDPHSTRASVLNERIALCEQPKVQGIDMKCVTSLESMVDYVISNIGENVIAKSNTVDKHMKMEFTMEGVTQVANDNEAMVCHKLDYPYGLFFCHTTVSIRAYVVNLVGEDGTKMEAISVCHKETTKELEDIATNVLKVKPGTTHICHFPEDAVIWYPNK